MTLNHQQSNMKLADISEIIQSATKWFEMTGNWPKQNPSFDYQCRHAFSWAIDISSLIYFFSEFTANLLNREYKELTALLTFMVSVVFYQIKHFIFDLNGKRFLAIETKLENQRFREYPLECDKYVRQTLSVGQKFMYLFQTVVVGVVLLYGLVPFFTDQDMALRLSVISLSPEMRWVFHSYEMLFVANAAFNHITMDLVVYRFISVASVQFEILTEKVINARRWAGLTIDEIDGGKVNPNLEMDPDLDKKVNKYLEECVKHHLDILDYINELQNCLSYFLLAQFADSLLVFCNTWFQFLLETDLIKIAFICTYSLALLVQLALYCMYGDELTQTSDKLGYACYSLDWYNSNNKIRKTLMLIMERAKRPVVLSAGKISEIALRTLVGISKMSYSYFALMNNLYNN